HRQLQAPNRVSSKHPTPTSPPPTASVPITLQRQLAAPTASVPSTTSVSSKHPNAKFLLAISNGAIARMGDHRTQDAGRYPGTQRRRLHRTWRSDQPAQNAIEAPLSGELGSPPLGQAMMNASPAVFKRVERRAGRQLGAPYG